MKILTILSRTCSKQEESKVIHVHWAQVQLLQKCLTFCDPMDCSTSGFPVLHHLRELAQTHVHSVGDAMQPSHPLSSLFLPVFNLSQYQGLIIMSWLLASGGQSTGASASASVLPMNIQDWFPLRLIGLILQSKGLSSLLQHHSLKASTLQYSAIFMVHVSHLSMTTGKTTDVTRCTYVGKVMSLLFNMLSRLVIAFLPRSKHLNFMAFNFMAAVTIRSDFGDQDNKVSHYFHCFPIYLPWSDGTGCHDLSFWNAPIFTGA